MLPRLFHVAAAVMLLSVAGRPALVHAQQDEIYGDDFEGFDPPACDFGIPSQPADVIDYAKALDLCTTATAAGAAPGVVGIAWTLPSGSGTPSAQSHAVRPQFGTGTQPVFGAALVVLSTGAAAGKGDSAPGYVAFEPGYDVGTSSAFPADWLAANGGVEPTAPGCPALAGNTANNAVMLTLNVRVPGNAHSFSVGANFFSADFPEYVCSPYNDVFVALLDSSYAGTPANPPDKNLARYVTPTADVVPVGVNLAWGNTGLFRQCLKGTVGCLGTPGTIDTCVSTDGLAGTGMDDPHAGACDADSMVGGGTGWLVMRGNVVPGETITLRFAIWDTSDGTSDSLVLLDHFRWSPQNVTPGTTIQ